VTFGACPGIIITDCFSFKITTFDYFLHYFEVKSRISSGRRVIFAGKIIIAQLPLLNNILEFMIPNDSGQAHFSAPIDRLTSLILGPETPALYESLGETRPVYVGWTCSSCGGTPDHCITAYNYNIFLLLIKPDRVVEIIQSNFGKFNAASR
jgi:hypothetical protein